MCHHVHSGTHEIRIEEEEDKTNTKTNQSSNKQTGKTSSSKTSGAPAGTYVRNDSEELEGEIISFLDDQPVVSNFELADGEYTYKVIIGEKRPIDFLFGK